MSFVLESTLTIAECQFGDLALEYLFYVEFEQGTHHRPDNELPSIAPAVRNLYIYTGFF